MSVGPVLQAAAARPPGPAKAAALPALHGLDRCGRSAATEKVAAEDWGLLWSVLYSRRFLFLVLLYAPHLWALLEPAGVLLIGIGHTQHRRFVKGLPGNL